MVGLLSWSCGDTFLVRVTFVRVFSGFSVQVVFLVRVSVVGYR